MKPTPTPFEFVKSCQSARPTHHLFGWGSKQLGEMVQAQMDESAYLRCQVQLLTDQAERLLPTDEERDAVEWASKTLCVGWHDLAPEDKQRTRDAADTLRGLLDRLKCATH